MKTTIIALMLMSLLFGCAKNQELTPSTQITANVNPMAISTGSFMSGAHTTSGSIKIAEDAQDKTKKYLVFENFKTDAGPDLKIYLSDDLKATNFVEVAKLDKTGNFSELIPTTADLNKQKYVLIWCKQFTVLFGSAQLK